MALTAKPISTISYNTESFLKDKLEALYNADKIEEYRYIRHYKDHDPKTGEVKKEHFHVWVLPNTRLDTGKLRKVFTEVDPNNTLPLTCQPWNKSNEDDWLLYVVHDPDYIEMKSLGDEGKEPYDLDEVQCTDRALLQQTYDHAKGSIVLSKEQQRDALARFIMGTEQFITLSMMYEYSMSHGYIDGYQHGYRMLQDLIKEHNESIQKDENIQALAERKAVTKASAIVNDRLGAIEKAIEIAENFGATTISITGTDGQEHDVVISAPSRSQKEGLHGAKATHSDIWDGYDGNNERKA